MHECVELSVFIYLLLQVCLHGMEVLMFEIQAQGSINNLAIGTSAYNWGKFPP